MDSVLYHSPNHNHVIVINCASCASRTHLLASVPLSLNLQKDWTLQRTQNTFNPPQHHMPKCHQLIHPNNTFNHIIHQEFRWLDWLVVFFFSHRGAIKVLILNNSFGLLPVFRIQMHLHKFWATKQLGTQPDVKRCPF